MTEENLLVQWLSFLQRKKKVVISLAITLVVISCALTWNYWKTLNDSFKAFESIAHIQELSSAKENKNLEAIQKEAQNSFESYPSAASKSIFLVYKADALHNLGKKNEAIEILEQAVSMMSDGFTKELHEIKLALLKIDTNKDSLVSEGISSLESISSVGTSPADEVATFKLHEYFWAIEDFEKAKELGGSYLLRFGDVSKKNELALDVDSSSFLRIVKDNMQSIAVD